MATTGQINTNKLQQSNGNYSYFWVYWEQNGDQDIANNKTRIYWSCGVYCGADFYSNAVKMGPVTINGTQVYGGGTYSNLDKGDRRLASGYLDIYHEADGTKQFTIDAFTGWLYSTGNFSSNGGSFWLESIPRASQPSCITYPQTTAHIGNLGDKIHIHMNSASGSFRHNVFYWYNNAWIDIERDVQNNCLWEIPYELANNVPSGKTCSGKIAVDTYKGTATNSADTGNFLGTKIVEFTATVPDNNTTKPKVTDRYIEPIEGVAPWHATLYVSKRTKVKAYMWAEPQLGSSLTEYGFNLNGTYKGVACNVAEGTQFTQESQVVQGQGSVHFEFWAKDSRGFWKGESVDKWFEPYDKPYIAPHTQNDRIVCARCDENGNLKDNGQHLRLTLSKQWWPLSSDGNRAQVWYKVTTLNSDTGCDSGWIVLSDYDVTDASGIVNIDKTITDITLELDQAYNVEIWVQDLYYDYGWGKDSSDPSYRTYNFRVPMEEVTFHLKDGGGGAAFGEYATEKNVVKIKDEWNLRYKGSIMTDFVVDHGTVDGDGITWTYEKWNSGVAKCWGVHTKSNVAITAAWGSLFESAGYVVNLPSELFIETPQFSITLIGSGEPSAVMLSIYSTGSKTQSPNMCAVRATAGTVSKVNTSIHAVGRWK